MLIEKTQDQYKEYCETLKKFPEAGFQEFKQQMDKLCREHTEIKLVGWEKLSVKDMTFKEEKDEGKLQKVSN